MKVSFDPNSVAPKLGPKSTTFKPGESGAGSFAKMLAGQVKAVDAMQHAAAAAESGMALGQVDIQEAVIATQKADVSFRLLMQVRNKALEAYREIMHMQF